MTRYWQPVNAGAHWAWSIPALIYHSMYLVVRKSSTFLLRAHLDIIETRETGQIPTILLWAPSTEQKSARGMPSKHAYASKCGLPVRVNSGILPSMLTYIHFEAQGSAWSCQLPVQIRRKSGTYRAIVFDQAREFLQYLPTFSSACGWHDPPVHFNKDMWWRPEVMVRKSGLSGCVQVTWWKENWCSA